MLRYGSSIRNAIRFMCVEKARGKVETRERAKARVYTKYNTGVAARNFNSSNFYQVLLLLAITKASSSCWYNL